MRENTWRSRTPVLGDETSERADLFVAEALEVAVRADAALRLAWLGKDWGKSYVMDQVHNSLRLRVRRWYPWAFVGFAGAFFAAALLFTPSSEWFLHALTALGASGGFVGFLYASHREDTRLFMELFRSFNERYDSLNEELSRIAADDAAAELSVDDANKFIDYFNLCAEEYLFYTAGYIDERVWRSWVCGMAYFAKVSRIRHLWEEELRHGSYYGFTLRVIELHSVVSGR